MIDRRESFIYRDFPVVPDDVKEDSWIIYSPFSNEKRSLKSIEELKQIDDLFFRKEKEFYTKPYDIYITSEINHVQIKKSIELFINEHAESEEFIPVINIVTENINENIDEFLYITSVVNRMDKERSITISLTTYSVIDKEILEELKQYKPQIYIKLEHKDIIFKENQEKIKLIHHYLEDFTIGFIVDKQSVFQIRSNIILLSKLGVNKINIDVHNKRELNSIKEIYVLNLLQGIKESWKLGVEVLNSNFHKHNYLNPLNYCKTDYKPEKCVKCFAKSLCKGDCEFECYVVTHTFPSIIKTAI